MPGAVQRRDRDDTGGGDPGSLKQLHLAVGGRSKRLIGRDRDDAAGGVDHAHILLCDRRHQLHPPGPSTLLPGRKGLASELLDLGWTRSEEHTSELQSLMRTSYA